MEEIMRHYGIGLLQMVGAIGICMVFGRILLQSGELYGMVSQYMTGICG